MRDVQGRTREDTLTTDHKFSTADYSVFGVTLVVSLCIGVYQALSGGRQRTISEYLVGNRKMTILPVTISLMVSFESSVMMLGTPAEVYIYGMQYLIGSLGYNLSQLIAVWLMVPLLHPLKLTSAYEYLELRFKSRFVRKVGSALGIICGLWYMGTVLFGPAIAIQAVTGFSQWNTIFLVAIAAVIYTSIGGLKAVVWTDVFQAGVMFAGMLAVLIKGTHVVGGPSEVFRRAKSGGRVNLFIFDFDPTVRHTFWNLLIGKTITGLSLVFNQSSIQRMAATDTLRQAKTVFLLVCPAFLVIGTMAVMEGVVAYSYYDYRQCDPLQSKQISDPNQIIPYMVMDIFYGLPGMPGLFLASLVSASLSTISSVLSSISALTWKDFVEPLFPHLSELQNTVVAKSSVVLFGLLACGVALLVSIIGGPMTQILPSVTSAFGGPLAGLFLAGALCSSANRKGVILGTVVSFVLTLWISMGATFSPHRHKWPWLPPASTLTCQHSGNDSFVNYTFATTRATSEDSKPQGVEKMYLLSYAWFHTVGVLTVIVISIIVGHITGTEEDRPDSKYVVDMWSSCRCVPRSVRHWFTYGSLKEQQEGTSYHEKTEMNETTPPLPRSGDEGKGLWRRVSEETGSRTASTLHSNIYGTKTDVSVVSF